VHLGVSHPVALRQKLMYFVSVRFQLISILSKSSRSWVRFPALPDVLRSSGSGTGSTRPREDNWGATWKNK
jgi:hypothetical protein